MELPVYLDSQASGRIAPEVREAVYEYWQRDNGNPHSAHEQGRRAKDTVSDAIATVADFVGCLPRELTLVSGATAANNLAIKGIEHLAKENRQKILVSAIEHPCVLETARFMSSERGFEMAIIPVDRYGFVDMDVLEDRLTEQVSMVSIMLGNNEIGTIQSVSDISELAHSVGALVHTDATQACGKIPVDVLELGCDMLSLSAHKISGPIGIGALFVRSGIELLPLIHGGNQQPFASGTMSPELTVGFARACQIAENNVNTEECERQNSLISRFENGLRAAGYIFTKNGPTAVESRLPGTTHITFQNVDLTELQAWIAPFVSFSTKSACATESSKISHVLEAIGLDVIQADNSARFSVSYRTSEQEIITAVNYFEEFFSFYSSRGAAE